ncbi:MAG TPA: FAD-binding oxidoreductase [Casimicrobiaceae bacterium]
MTDPHATFVASLAAIAGAANVLTAHADVEPFVNDWRGRYHGAAVAVVRPKSTDEVAAIVRECARVRMPIVTQGGNTGMVGGATPLPGRDQVVVSLARMNAVRGVDPANATITVEAGVTLAATQAAASAAGMRFPLSLASEGSCTIGGNLSTNAGGTAVLRFGNARDFVLGLEVVLPDGQRWDGLRALRKDNTGYDMKQWFVGAEGTLGIITAAVLKLYPAPRAQVTALVGVPGVAAAVALLGMLRNQLGDRLEGFELISAFALALSRKHHPSPDPLPGLPWYVLVQASDSAEGAALANAVEQALGTAIEREVAVDASIAQSISQADALWALRENISEAQRREGPNIKHDIALPVSAVPRFLQDAGKALTAALPGVRYVVFGHLGDGNLHYNLSAPAGEDATQFLHNTATANRIVHDLVNGFGGSISAEHGIGQLKHDELVRYKTPLEIALMQRLKHALDPDGLFNPGKVVG